MKQGQFPAILNLTDLNGKNGFKLDGEAVNDYSGYSVSSAGDINGDGISDLMVGADGHASATGRSYVVFGGSEVGNSGLIALSGLNGSNGFKLDGEAPNDHSAQSISAVGDINEDGVSDVLIGAQGHASFTGRSYVVFGGPKVGSSGLIALSGLNGSTGFKLDGEVSNDGSGYWVNTAGDINGDGVPDLLIGAAGHASGTGRSYVVFGGARVGGSGLIALSGLNGSNGFKLDGEVMSSDSGLSVSATGDINGDGTSDLLIGAPYYAGNTGRSYAVFGGAGIGGLGTIALSGLNGSTGFKLDGEASGDYSGFPVSAVGDINGDGVSDLLIGADGHASGTGCSYVIFGRPGVGGSGLVALSELNGSNGFKLEGEAPGDRSGVSVSMAGDINGDGISDLLIGAQGHVSYTGRSYVVFGGPRVGNSGLVALSGLNGVTGFKLDGEATNDQSGFWVNAAGDINGDGVSDLLIGALGHASNTGRSYVVFGDIPPILVNNSLSLSVGATIHLNSTFLAATDRNHQNNTLVFIPSAVEHGQFEVISDPGVPLVNFTQQQVTDGTIQFVHDGTLIPPSYNITVRSTGIAWVGPVPAKISFIGAPQSYFPSILPLGSLNGQNGFKLDGENNNDYSGFSVNTAGDINGDDYSDLLIGAYNYPAGVAKGRSYVVFGGPGVGNNGDILLSNLNGTNGFKLDGENNKDYSGYPVHAASDINGDSYTDFLIGAYNYPSGSAKGRSYVVFGGPGVGSTGDILLASLNGTNGFKLDGENNGDLSGSASGIAGDINGDGYIDLVIGANLYISGSEKGRSYVVFGGPGVGSSGDILLAGLNGSNGFKLDGENNHDFSGVSVNNAGDINGDGYSDLLIGASAYLSGSNNKGRSYVVFGGPGVGSSGDILLSSLNGANGFKLDGENNNDFSGNSVCAAGDINGDGYADLLIGAMGYPGGGYKGRGYVLFGGPNVGNSGSVLLSNLNGSNGFKLDGENNNDNNGLAIGDINDDGYTDLAFGAQGYPGGNYQGRIYVIFGGTGVGSSGDILLSSLNGINGFKLDGENNNDHSGVDVSSAGDVNGDSIEDLLIGAYGYPGGSARGRSYVVFGDAAPTLVQNRLSLYPGLSVSLNASFLSAYDRNHDNNTLMFFPANVTHGSFEKVDQPGIPLTNFTQAQLLNSTIQFVHDSSAFPPAYNITVRSAGIAWTGPSSANITFTRPAPIMWVNNQLSISNGTQMILSPLQLQATEAGFNSSQLVFLVGGVQNGYFTLTAQNTSRLTRFTQAQIDSGDITFVHTGDGQAPNYNVIVTDGVQYTTPGVPTIYFTNAPIIIENTLTLQPGETVTLAPSNLNVTITDGSTPGQVICRVEDLQHATITQFPSGLPISNFTLADLQSGKVQVTQDSSNYAAVSYVISCGGQKGINSVPSTVDTHFSYNGVLAPQLINNYLLIQQGGVVPLSLQNIRATQNGSQSLDSNAQFYISAVTHGQFSLNSIPGSIISSFSQGQLQNGSVTFTQDNSRTAPGYQLSVRALGLESASLPAVVIFLPVNQPPQLMYSLTDQTATVGEPFTYAIPVDSFVDPEGGALTFGVSRYNSSVPLPGWLHFDESTQRFIGTPVIKDFIDVNVTAQDPEGLSTTTDFTITVDSPSSGSGFTTWQKTILGALLSGGIGIGFALAQICLKRIANKKLLQVLGEGDSQYDQDVVRPVMKELAQRIKITRFMNATTNKELMAFKSAVRSLLAALSMKGVNLNFTDMTPEKKDAVINEIGNQTYRWMRANQQGCGARCPGLQAFFKPQLRAEELQDAADEIADQVVLALPRRVQSQPNLSRDLSVSGSPVFKELKDKRSMELPEIDTPSKKGVELEDPAAVQLN
jgi:hypothetical protein